MMPPEAGQVQNDQNSRRKPCKAQINQQLMVRETVSTTRMKLTRKLWTGTRRDGRRSRRTYGGREVVIPLGGTPTSYRLAEMVLAYLTQICPRKICPGKGHRVSRSTGGQNISEKAARRERSLPKILRPDLNQNHLNQLRKSSILNHSRVRLETRSLEITIMIS